MRTMVVLPLLMFAGFQASVQGQCEPSPRQIRVSGDAEILVAPDKAIIEFGVHTIDLDLDVSKSKNGDVVRSIIDGVTELGVEPPSIQTEYLRIWPAYKDTYEDTPQDFLGYRCHSTIVVTLTDLTKFEAVITTALKNGANYIHNVDLQTSERQMHRDELISQALKDAKAKASKMAAELGQSLGQPYYISGGLVQDSGQSIFSGSGGGSQDTKPASAPGKIAISASVTVMFELQDAGD